jgi:hypothetical protein
MPATDYGMMFEPSNTLVVGWVGETDFDWVAEESETVAVRMIRSLDAATSTLLSMAFPNVFGGQSRAPCDTWITVGTFTPQVAAILETEIREQFPGLEIRERLK